MRLLLDTHAFLWFILDDPQLSAKADAVISVPNNDIEISPASYWEIAIKSIGANIAEGEGRGSFQDNRRFVRIARGSLNETKHWLRRAFKRRLLSETQIAKLKPLLDELAPRLNAYLKSIGNTQPRTTDN